MKLRALLPLALILPLAGCGLVTSRAIRHDFLDYNDTLQINQNQQMLLNIVRLRYRESPIFVQVGALASSYRGTVDGSMNTFSQVWTFGFNLGSSFESAPTITYSPIQGDTFIKQILRETQPATFALLLRSGWPIKVLAELMIESVGAGTDRLVNQKTHPSYPQFQQQIQQLQQEQDSDQLDVVASDGRLFFRVPLAPQGLARPDVGDIKGLTGIPLDSFQLRSLLDIMFFLGKNTEVPEARQDRAKPAIPNDFMTIHSAWACPNDVFVAVTHGGYCYYISSSDIRSKDSLALVNLIFQAQAEDVSAALPVLTIPVR